MVCPNCGHENEAGARFCSACGRAFEQLPVREERKIVTVLFADIVGSTARADQVDPEDVRAALSSYYARVREELEHRGGMVEKFIGDAVMAVFGAPVAHEDDPERAVRAALAIRDRLAGSDVDVRIAVHTGEALVALGARATEGEAMVAGDVVNTAARLQSAAPVNGILVGETTFRATELSIEYREAPPVQAKGKLEPVPVWEALAPRARLGVDVDQVAETELVGRAAEVGLLRDGLQRARSERQPQLLTLVGVPGIGKSRLITELFALVEAEPDLIWWRQGRCLPYGEGISFWALGEMAKAQAGVLETDTSEEAEAKLRDAVSALVPEGGDAEWMLGHLRPLIGLPGASGEQAERFAAWRSFLEALAEQRPAVLVFEDLHWADDGLLDFVDHLADWASGVPILIVCAARPELLARRPGWGGGKPNASTVSLSPLSDEEVARLITRLLGRAVLPAETQAELLRRADGNPLYAEEYVRMLRDGRDPAEALPETVQGIIAARLDALSREEKELVQDAAVIGKVFWLGAVTSIGGVDRWTAEKRLHALERKEFVRRERRSSVGAEAEYVFRHVLVRDVGYGQIPRSARADKHRAAAQWIEALGEDRSEDRAEMLAHHYGAALEFLEAAGLPTVDLRLPARDAFWAAGERAAALGGGDEALSRFERALELTEQDDKARPRLLTSYGRALSTFRLEGEPELREAANALIAAGEPEQAAHALRFLRGFLWQTGRTSDSLDEARRAVDLVADRPPSAEKAEALSGYWRNLWISGGAPPEGLVDEALELAERYGSIDQIIDARINRALERNLENGGGVSDLEEALRLGIEHGSHLVPRAYINLASTLGSLGDLQRAWELHREGLVVSRRLGELAQVRFVRAELIIGRVDRGEWDEAFAEAREFITECESAPHYMEAAVQYAATVILLARGEPGAARAHADRGIALARDIGDPQVWIPIAALWARFLAETGDTSGALDTWKEIVARPVLRSLLVEEGVIEAPIAGHLLGRAAEFLPVLDRLAPFETVWTEVVREVAASRLSAAADRCAAAGSEFYAAYLSLLAAEAGERVERIGEAAAFFERVGAHAYLRRLETILPATA